MSSTVLREDTNDTGKAKKESLVTDPILTKEENVGASINQSKIFKKSILSQETDIHLSAHQISTTEPRAMFDQSPTLLEHQQNNITEVD